MKELLQLTTERPELTLRQLDDEADAKAVLAAIDENQPYLSQLNNIVGTKFTSVEAIMADWEEDPDAIHMGLWQDQDALKTVINAFPKDDTSVEIAYWTRYNAQGNGFAAVAVKALGKHLWPNYEHIMAKVHSQNSGSAKVLQNAGYTFTGISEETWCEDAMVFELTK